MYTIFYLRVDCLHSALCVTKRYVIHTAAGAASAVHGNMQPNNNPGNNVVPRFFRDTFLRKLSGLWIPFFDFCLSLGYEKS